ncbi:MAG: toll/interleukin-1 receptor domain-containing protein [Chloroflexota bacterium]
MSHVFISYSTKDSDYAYKLADKLREEGFDVWIDNAELRSSIGGRVSFGHYVRQVLLLS